MAKHKKESEGNEKLCAALSYILIGIIWYFADANMKKDKFVKFHVKQGIVLIIAAILWSILLNILFGTLVFGGAWGLWGIWRLLSYVPLVFAVLGIINSLNHKESELPIIGKFAKHLTF